MRIALVALTAIVAVAVSYIYISSASQRRQLKDEDEDAKKKKEKDADADEAAAAAGAAAPTASSSTNTTQLTTTAFVQSTATTTTTTTTTESEREEEATREVEEATVASKAEAKSPTPQKEETAQDEEATYTYYSQKMVAIYQVHNPSKVEDVPMLLEKYKGQEAAMLARLEEKYSQGGAAITPPPTPMRSSNKNNDTNIDAASLTYEQRIVDIYTLHNPDKIKDVPMLLQKYAGKEEEMINYLEAKYLSKSLSLSPTPSTSAFPLAYTPPRTELASETDAAAKISSSTSKSSKTPVMKAAKASTPAVVVEELAPINIGEKLYAAARDSNEEELRGLCVRWKGHSILNYQTEQKWTSSFICAYNNDRKCLSLLMDAGADVEVKNNNGATPLWIASQRGNASCVELLLSSGSCDFNMPNADGHTPIFAACATGADTCLALLIDAGADAGIKNKSSITPCFVACEKGHDACLKLVLGSEQGLATLDMPNKLGFSPLFIAVDKNFEACVEALLCFSSIRNSGIDLNRKCFNQTVLAVAKSKKLEDIEQMLIAAGATA